jgi:hypothetical protein
MSLKDVASAKNQILLQFYLNPERLALTYDPARNPLRDKYMRAAQNFLDCL